MESEKSQKTTSVNLSEPMFFWIFLLVVAIILNTLLTYTPAGNGSIPQYALLGTIANFILSGPGLLILPLIAGAVIGAEVGLRTRNTKTAVKAGFLNGVYGSVIYIIAIIILYEVVVYALPKSGLTLGQFVSNWVVVPVIAFIIVIEAFAVLSNSRKTAS